MARYGLSDTDLEKIYGEELGIPLGRYVNLGPTGRTVRWSDGTQHNEMADFELEDCAERAKILSEDDICDAMVQGVRDFLRNNKAAFVAKIMEAAEEMKAELLAEEPYDATAGR